MIITLLKLSRASAVALVAAAFAACPASLFGEVPDDVRITCNTDSDCLRVGDICSRRGVCVPADGPPRGLTGAPTLEPLSGGRETTFTLRFEVDGTLAELPSVKVDVAGVLRLFAYVESASDAESGRYVYRYTVDESDRSGAWPITIDLVAENERVFAGLSAGNVTFDFSAPRVDLVEPFPALVGIGTVLSGTLLVDEALSVDPTVTLVSTADGAEFAFDVTASATALTYALSFHVDELPALREGAFSVHYTATDAVGNATTGVLGSLVIDRTAPVLMGALSVRLYADPQNPLADPTAMKNGTSVQLAGEASELLLHPPLVVARCDDTLVSFDVTGELAFVAALWLNAQVSAPDGPCSVEVTLTDRAGNVTLAGGTETEESAIVIDRTVPQLVAADIAHLVHVRVPWGAENSAGQAGHFIVEESDQDGDPRSARIDRALIADENLVELRAWTAATGGFLIGRAFTTTGDTFPPLTMLTGDADEIFVSVIDHAGNTSPRRRITRRMWRATLGNKVTGSTFANPHALYDVNRFTGSLDTERRIERGASATLRRIDDTTTCEFENTFGTDFQLTYTDKGVCTMNAPVGTTLDATGPSTPSTLLSFDPVRGGVWMRVGSDRWFHDGQRWRESAPVPWIENSPLLTEHASGETWVIETSTGPSLLTPVGPTPIFPTGGVISYVQWVGEVAAALNPRDGSVWAAGRAEYVDGALVNKEQVFRFDTVTGYAHVPHATGHFEMHGFALESESQTAALLAVTNPACELNVGQCPSDSLFFVDASDVSAALAFEKAPLAANALPTPRRGGAFYAYPPTQSFRVYGGRYLDENFNCPAGTHGTGFDCWYADLWECTPAGCVQIATGLPPIASPTVVVNASTGEQIVVGRIVRPGSTGVALAVIDADGKGRSLPSASLNHPVTTSKRVARLPDGSLVSRGSPFNPKDFVVIPTQGQSALLPHTPPGGADAWANATLNNQDQHWLTEWSTGVILFEPRSGNRANVTDHGTARTWRYSVTDARWTLANECNPLLSNACPRCDSYELVSKPNEAIVTRRSTGEIAVACHILNAPGAQVFYFNGTTWRRGPTLGATFVRQDLFLLENPANALVLADRGNHFAIDDDRLFTLGETTATAAQQGVVVPNLPSSMHAGDVSTPMFGIRSTSGDTSIIEWRGGRFFTSDMAPNNFFAPVATTVAFDARADGFLGVDTNGRINFVASRRRDRPAHLTAFRAGNAAHTDIQACARGENACVIDEVRVRYKGLGRSGSTDGDLLTLPLATTTPNDGVYAFSGGELASLTGLPARARYRLHARYPSGTIQAQTFCVGWSDGNETCTSGTGVQPDYGYWNEAILADLDVVDGSPMTTPSVRIALVIGSAAPSEVILWVERVTLEEDARGYDLSVFAGGRFVPIATNIDDTVVSVVINDPTLIEQLFFGDGRELWIAAVPSAPQGDGILPARIGTDYVELEIRTRVP